MTTILISGGNGLLGKHLSKKLKEKAYKVVILSRSLNQNAEILTYSWNYEKNEIDKEAVKNVDYIIHLAGENISEKRWTPKRKQLIIESRVKTANLLFKTVKEYNPDIKAFISASAVGYYGSITSDRIFIESDPPATDFLGECCRQWEAAADQFEEIDIRTVKIRTGVVLTKKGGALGKMIQTVKIGIGSALGNGKQNIPWIHIDDLCGIYIKAIEDSSLNGAYNAVAADYKTNDEFTGLLAKTLRKPYFFPAVPAFILKLIFGKMSEIILKGSKISSEKIKSSGYHFQYPELENAFKNLLT